MSRQDLLALTTDDLTVLSNRGLVKRALKELDEGNLLYELAEDEQGNISVRWSDAECILPTAEQISDRHCNCSATSICRHLIRSILVYQRDTKIESNKSISFQPWNPGEIKDAELEKYFNKATLTKAKREFDSGHVIELIKSNKPVALIHTLSYTVRFLVPDEIRYTYCDCAEKAPCRHVLFAVWAFRLLDVSQLSGVISTQKQATPAPIKVLDDIEENLQAVLSVGIRGLTPALIGRLQRLEQSCRACELIWHAEILAELLQEQERYAARDARFSPTQVVSLMGELCVRSDAVRNNTGAVPQLFIRGSQADKITEIGAARLIGLGCGVQIHPRSAILTAYLQDTDSGTVVVVCQDFRKPSKDRDEPLPDFWQLAQKHAVKQVCFATLGASQMLIKGGKRTPNYRFLPGRAQVVVNPQTYEWESLRPPLLVEDFASLRANLAILPPASLRSRRLTDNFYVFAVSRVESVRFDSVEQAVVAVLYDLNNTSASLKFPYYSHSHAGTDALLAQLVKEKLDFVAGQINLTASGLVITPVSLVFCNGEMRELLQPWIHSQSDPKQEALIVQSKEESARNPIAAFLLQLEDALSELLLLGLQRIDSQHKRRWQQIRDNAGALGFLSFLNPIDKLVAELEKDGSWQAMAQYILIMCVQLKLAQELTD